MLDVPGHLAAALDDIARRRLSGLDLAGALGELRPLVEQCEAMAATGVDRVRALEMVDRHRALEARAIDDAFDPPPTPSGLLEQIRAGIADGRPCDELMEVRLALKRTDPKCPELVEANDLLRSYCFPESRG